MNGRLLTLVQTSQAIATTRSRLKKVAAMVEFFRTLDAQQLAVAVCYLAGEIPQGKIGVGYASIRDSRKVAPASEPTLTLLSVDTRLSAMRSLTGAGSSNARNQQLASLFGEATADEQQFLAELLSGGVRHGALEGLVVDAIAQAAGLPLAAVRRAQMLVADLGAVAKIAKDEGEIGLSRIQLEVFRPVQPMLAQTAETVGEAVDQLGRAALEWKLDGARIQVHKSGGDVQIFSRQLNDVTERIPEIVEIVRSLPARELILDGEVIALAPSGSPRPFQETMRRFGRKLDVGRALEQQPLSPYFFDLMYCDGQSLIDAGTEERTRVLAEVVEASMRVPRLVSADQAEAAQFLRDALDRGHEGIMAKSLDAPYEAGHRGASWLKLKHAHTLDLVVIGVEWGSGRRKGWLSNIHLAARDAKAGGYVMLGKTFKGMTDKMLQWQTARFLSLETHRDGHTVYLRPEQVVEVAISDVQQSPHYPAGMALRFARVKQYRQDKGPEQADTLDTVRQIFSRSMRVEG